MLRVLEGVARACFTERADGDFASRAQVESFARAHGFPVPHEARQVHGVGVIVARGPGRRHALPADALISSKATVAVAVRTADCVPLLLADPDAGLVAAVHAGWRGLAAGVVEKTLAVLARLGARRLHAAIGPSIRACCFAVGADVAKRLAARGVPVDKREGAIFADLAAGVRAVLTRRGVRKVEDVALCTACSPRFYSWRARKETARMLALVAPLA